MKLGTNFLKAITDYLYLLEQHYPQKPILKLVGNKYALTKNERALLFRGAIMKGLLELREQKKVLKLPENSELVIDGFNTFRTIGSYLNGNFVFEGMDGFLRDASELHQKKLSWEVLERAADLIIGFLNQKKCAFARFYFDTPISHSGELAGILREKMQKASLRGTVETIFSPDHCLKKVETGIICTADSNIIDKSLVQVYDLAKGVLEYNFHPCLFSLAELEGSSRDLK